MSMRIPAILILLTAAGCHGSSDDGSGNNPPSPPGPAAGLDQRPSNLTCLAPSTNGGAGVDIELTRVFTSLPPNLSQPLAMLQAPSDASRWFVLEKTGRVRVFANTPNVAAFDADFIDIPASFPTFNDASEGGLLGMAFHPGFATNREVFLSWTEGTPMVSVIARFTSLDGGATLDPGSREDIIRVNQPFTNHDGGQIAFGPDGFLYIGFGDGGSGGDPDGHAQNTRDLLGNMLRIDVDGAVPYAIPASNPFSGGARCPADHTSTTNCPEIYAFGFRNPWRWSFDTATGELWVGDVGQNAFEEIDRVELGGNYGWDCREGSSTFGSPAPSCAVATNLIDPVHEYGRSFGFSVTGGYVYRGSQIPALVGDYVFGDYGSGVIWRLVDAGSGGFAAQNLLDTSLSIASFGEDEDGELYVVDIAQGRLYRIDDAGGGAPAPPPVATLLSDTGCVNPQNPAAPAAGLIPYRVAAPFWSDGADKERWLAIPNGTTIAVQAGGDFAFPPGSVLMKHFRLAGNLIETRLFMRHPSGDWAGYSYEWNAQGSDATLIQGGKVAPIGTQNWIFPSGNDCLTCHTAAAGFALGLEAAELNHAFTYQATGRTANQLTTLDAIALFAAPLGDPSALPELPDPADALASLDTRARAYLHTNCAHCHRAGGPTPSSMDLRFDTLLAMTLACDAVPQAGDLNMGPAARIIAPGAPGSSVLLARMNRRDAVAMPPLASSLVDDAGVALIRDWIASLASCL
ncbi:MAG TPA: PQQ-dependent sugar dehydrogenase [Gammaproteobacteria bacterium]